MGDHDSILSSDKIEKLAIDIEEATRASQEGVRRFIEPKQGTLRRSIIKRHHIVFGRRGSGKSSLLNKARNNLTLDRHPVAYVDLETFKGHSYPDVLISVLIESLKKFAEWLETAGIYSANKKTWWERFFSGTPNKKAVNRRGASELVESIRKEIETLNKVLFEAEAIDRREVTADESVNKTGSKLGGKFGHGPVAIQAANNKQVQHGESRQIEDTYTYEKEAYLHRNIQQYRALFSKMKELTSVDAFLILDDLYHIRRLDQARVIDYFHRIAKNNGLWLKVGTIRHRTTWYKHGNPPIGVKLGDDADDIDLDISLEQFGLAKDFLTKILGEFANDAGFDTLETFLTDEATDRLVLASGGVARDFLGVFRRSIETAKLRIIERGKIRGLRIGAEDVNEAAGKYDTTKQEELQKDTETEERSDIEKVYENIRLFCTRKAKANILLVDKDIPPEQFVPIEELVDLRLLHKIRSNETISKRQGRKFSAYMLDLSQYTGQRKIKNFDMIDFWKHDVNLRQVRFMYDPKTDYSTEPVEPYPSLRRPESAHSSNSLEQGKLAFEEE